MSKWNKNWFACMSVILIAAVALAGCSSPSGSPATSTPAKSINLNGAGATFPAPLYTKWFDEYNKLTGVKVNYQPIGSGGGISQITEGTVDFGATDGIMTEAELTKAESKSGPILHIPMTSGSVAVIYNLAGIGTGQLKLTGAVLADIYLKKIAKWNNPAIAALNPDLKLPDAAIAVVFRSDGSGTTYIFTNYLSKISQDFKSTIGNAKAVKWPGDIGGQGNAGVAGQVQQIPNSIGYVEMAYAEQNKLAWAKLKNAAGNFLEPSLQATTKAAEGVSLPDDMKIMLTNSSNPEAYPIVGFTWILVYVNQKDKDTGVALAKMLWWAIHDGQQYTEPLSYARLAESAVSKAETAILSINYQGQPLITR
ncbi:MAG: phosphate ABC transporter substrate-binding protein PstS [Dehalococcoidia bacterium]|nr:phosphate ABC transporter substrate-binding protein PstS [Dehalococcoidia bacterium]